MSTTSKPDRFLITGCASGIGRHLAQVLLERGARVTATDVDYENLKIDAETLGWPAERLRLLRLDVTASEAWEEVADAAVAAWGGLDVVMNVAGFMLPGAVHEVRDADVHRHFDVNVKGVVFGTRTAAKRMIPQGHGHVVNIASLAGMVAIPGIALYSASKYAVRAFSLAAAEELRPHGIAVTAVCPDAVETPMLDRQADYEEAALTFTAPRFLTVDDVARVILGRVLDQRPLLVSLPRRRALLARFADLFPSAAKLIAAPLRRRGLARQKAFKTAKERSQR